jgi:hypothetical protein
VHAFPNSSIVGACTRDVHACPHGPIPVPLCLHGTTWSNLNSTPYLSGNLAVTVHVTPTSKPYIVVITGACIYRTCAVAARMCTICIPSACKEWGINAAVSHLSVNLKFHTRPLYFRHRHRGLLKLVECTYLLSPSPDRSESAQRTLNLVTRTTREAAARQHTAASGPVRFASRKRTV